MKIDFSKVIFTDESQVTFDRPDGWAKGWNFSNADVPLAKKKQQGGCSVITWVGIVNQTIVVAFKVDEKVELNCAIAISWTRLSLHGINLTLVISK